MPVEKTSKTSYLKSEEKRKIRILEHWYQLSPRQIGIEDYYDCSDFNTTVMKM